MAPRTPTKRASRKTASRPAAPKPDPDDRPEMTSVPHLDGCPEVREIDGEEVPSLEQFPATAPGGGTVWVTRCVQCGQASYS